MSRQNAMNDPDFSEILQVIEAKLLEADILATTRGLKLTDSNIRSLLVRAINEAKGKPAKVATADAPEKDRFLDEALLQLKALRAAIIEDWEQPDGSFEPRPLPTAHWISSLEAIKDSCAVRTSKEPGSRGYLDFLPGFLKQAADLE